MLKYLYLCKKMGLKMISYIYLFCIQLAAAISAPSQVLSNRGTATSTPTCFENHLRFLTIDKWQQKNNAASFCNKRNNHTLSDGDVTWGLYLFPNTTRLHFLEVSWIEGCKGGSQPVNPDEVCEKSMETLSRCRYR